MRLRATIGSAVDSLVKKPESRQQEGRYHNSTGILVRGPCLKKQEGRNQEVSMWSDRLTAHLFQGNFPDILSRNECPSPASTSPTLSSSSQLTAFLAASTTEISLWAGTTFQGMYKIKVKREEPAIQVFCLGKEKKNHSRTKGPTRDPLLKVVLFRSPAAQALPGPVTRQHLGLCPDLLNQSLFKNKIP